MKQILFIQIKKNPESADQNLQANNLHILLQECLKNSAHISFALLLLTLKQYKPVHCNMHSNEIITEPECCYIVETASKWCLFLVIPITVVWQKSCYQ